MRRAFNRIFPALCGLCALTACAVLLGLILVIAHGGLTALSWSFCAETIRQGGGKGGDRQVEGRAFGALNLDRKIIAAARHA